MKNLKEKNKPEPFAGPVLISDDQERPFLEHLEELRRRCLRSFLWLALGTGFAFRYSHDILIWLTRPVGRLVFLNPTEPFLIHVKIAFFGGIFLALPLLAWEGWGFVAPALVPRERRPVLLFVPLSVVLFLLGASFGWTVLVPTGLKFLLSFGSDSLVPMLTVGSYVSFTGWLIIGCGLIFQMPLGVTLLTRLGILRPRTLVRQWRLAVVGIFIVAAVLTPTPDVVNQTLLALPMIVLYLLSIGLAFLVWRGDPTMTGDS